MQMHIEQQKQIIESPIESADGEKDEGDYTMCKVMAIMAMMMMNIRMHAFIDNM